MRTIPLLLVAAVVAAAPAPTAQAGLPPPNPDAAVGLGLAVVRGGDAPGPLRFYAHPGLEALPDEVPVESATVTDSVTVAPGRPGAFTSAPPWFLPEVLDAARGRAALRVVTLAADWVEAVANRADGRRVWLRRDRVEVVPWPDVLLASLVTLRDPAAHPLRTRPSVEAPVLASTPEGWRLRVMAVRGDWLLVSTLGLADRIPPSGWVRWTDGERLLVGGIGEE